jgi:antitoxin HicB
MIKRHVDVAFDTHLKEVVVCIAAWARPIKEVVISQLTEAMQKQSLRKARLAAMLKTSRSQVDRLLDQTHDVTLSTLQRVVALVGLQVQIELV